MEMEALASQLTTALSGGQQQRAAIARALAFEPRVLLMDEPLSKLDAKLREQMRVELRALQQELGITTVYVTHDQEEAMVFADDIALNVPRLGSAGVTRVRTFVLVPDSTNPPGAASAAGACLPAMRRLTRATTETSVSAAPGRGGAIGRGSGEHVLVVHARFIATPKQVLTTRSACTRRSRSASP